MSNVAVNHSHSALGHGRLPASAAEADGDVASLTNSLSLSGSRSTSLRDASSGGSLSPLPLARAEYSSAAHLFLQRDAKKALQRLDEARRLLFEVVPVADATRQQRAWTSLREKVVILWITLLVSRRKNIQEHGDDRSGEGSLASTRELLDARSANAQAFCAGLLKEVTTAWANAAELSDVDKDTTKQLLLGRLPASVAASLVMAYLGVEESSAASSSGNTQRKGPSHVTSSAVPLTRALAEMLMNAQSEAGGMAMAAYARVIELYTIHILGVRCGEWDYADQVVRLSLLEDQPRADLLKSLSKAHTHISTRSERRASAAQAQQKAYEGEKQRRASAAKTMAEAEAQIQASTASTSRPARRARSTSYESSSAAESEGETSQRSSSRPTPPARARSSSQESGAADFAASRANLTRSIAKHHERDQAEVAVSSSRSAPTAAYSTSSSAAQQNSVLFLRSWMGALRRMNLPMLLSILAPLFVLIFSLRRLAARGGRTSGQMQRGGSGSRGRVAPAGGDNGNAGVAARLAQRLWSTVRMGTQVTYL